MVGEAEPSLFKVLHSKAVSSLGSLYHESGRETDEQGQLKTKTDGLTVPNDARQFYSSETGFPVLKAGLQPYSTALKIFKRHSFFPNTILRSLLNALEVNIYYHSIYMLVQSMLCMYIKHSIIQQS